jgi:hypothetical protein
MRARFNDRMMRDLSATKTAAARAWLIDLSERGMEVQGSPRPGRINVRFKATADTPAWSYRTYAATDLVIA